jgi:hypothetical protein
LCRSTDCNPLSTWPAIKEIADRLNILESGASQSKNPARCCSRPDYETGIDSSSACVEKRTPTTFGSKNSDISGEKGEKTPAFPLQ